MSYGRYSDDPLENSVFRDDELKVQEELDKEIQDSGGTDTKGSRVAVIVLFCIVAAFFLWFFFG